MSDLNYNVDDEISKYIDAYQIQKSGIGPRNLKSAPRRFNPITGEYDVLSRMQNGGYLKIGSEPLAMSEAPKQPSIVSQETEKMPDIGPQVESAMEYADTVKRKAGQVTADDMLAAGYDANTIKAIGIGADVERMVLSTQEIEDRLRNGGSFLEYDPTLRETGKVELTQYLLELAENSLAEDLRTELLERGSIETDGRLIQPLSTEQINQYIQTELEAERPRLINEADALSGMFFGSPSSLGIGVGDFVTAGIMDIQEGSRLFAQGQAGDSVADRAFGALLVIAGLAEATGVGMLVGKAIKKSIPTLRAGLADVGERLNQPGEMPVVGSNLGNVDELRREANTQRFGYDPNDPVAKVEAPTKNKPGIIAFHGSGADFDEFKLDMIGTGEGGQAFGYGLYFTDEESIAKFYKDASKETNYIQLQGKPLDSVYTADNEEKFSNYVIENFKPDEHDDVYSVIDNLGQGLLSIDDADAMAQTSLNKTQISLYKKIRNDLTVEELPEGKIYQVNLAPQQNELLDYDLQLKEQPKILSAIDEVHGDSEIILKQLNLDPETATGGDLIKALAGIVQTAESSKAAAEWMEKAGIPGIKYRAAGSRTSNITEDNAKRNYVIFDDKLIDIIKKYGIVPPVAVTAMAAKKDEKET